MTDNRGLSPIARRKYSYISKERPLSVDVREVERSAYQRMRDGNFEEAVNLFKSIILLHPNWEEGGAAFNLACCLEELKEYQAAKQAYELALKYDPNNEMFIGNYNSLLRLLKGQ
jgi:Flp pilus assembly protein TadD